MVLHASGIPQEYTLIFAYSDVEKVVEFATALHQEAIRVKQNAEKFLKPVEQQGCQHPKDRLKFTNEGVFCLSCNQPVLVPVSSKTDESNFRPVLLPNTPAPAAAPHLKPVQVQGQTIFVPEKAAPKPPISEEDKTTPDGEAEVKRAREETQLPLQRIIPQESEPKKDP